MKNNWLIPLTKYDGSMWFDVNFLWNHDNIFISDNHRIALWCWFQRINENEKYNLFHIDAHYDALSANLKKWVNSTPDLYKIPLEDYLSFQCTLEKGCSSRLFRYDNYLAIFINKYRHMINECVWATQKIGDIPCIYSKEKEIAPWELTNFINYNLSTDDISWILNIDLDYFFKKIPNGNEETYTLIFSDEYIKSIFKSIQNNLKNIKVLTIALSPEHCGNWENARKLCNQVSNYLELQLNLESI